LNYNAAARSVKPPRDELAETPYKGVFIHASVLV